MIREQKALLSETFALREDGRGDVEKINGLAKAQKQLAQDTEQFLSLKKSNGISLNIHESFQALVDELALAVKNMASAVDALEDRVMQEACDKEDAALTHLLRARLHVNKILAVSKNGSRQIAQKLRQELRLPESRGQQEGQGGQEDSLMDLAENADSLSKEEGDIKDALDAQGKKQGNQNPASGGGRPKSRDNSGLERIAGSDADGGTGSSQDMTGPSVPYQGLGGSAQNLANRQKEATEKGKDLAKRLARHRDATELARRRMDDALDDMGRAEGQLKKKLNPEGEVEAKKQLGQLERKLKKLSDHLKGLGADQLTRRMDMFQQTARKAAQQSGRSGGEARSALSGDADTLLDWMNALQEALQGEHPEITERLRKLSRQYRLDKLASDIKRAGKAEAQGSGERAARLDDQAQSRFQGLANGMNLEKRRLAQSLLEALIAAEKAATGIRGDLAGGQGDSSDMDSRIRELMEALENFEDGSLQAHSRPLKNAVQRPATERHGRGSPDAYYGLHGEEVARSLDAIAKRLQALIIESIQHKLHADKDVRIPAQYRRLVEQYYKLLSDDIR